MIELYVSTYEYPHMSISQYISIYVGSMCICIHVYIYIYTTCVYYVYVCKHVFVGMHMYM